LATHLSLQHQSHRPWPLPTRPWLLRQTWHDLLFLHWPVPAAVLQPLVPAALQVEEFAGTAWLAVTPFWMSDIGVRNWPSPPMLARFDELNVRTYVSFGGRSGVWFFSLDAGSRLAVWGARWLYRLPYVYARMRHQIAGDDVFYHSERSAGAGFRARYGPIGPVNPSRPGSVEHWLTERYCLYAPRPSGGLYRADIHHVPWPLQPAGATIARNDLLELHGIPQSGPPKLLHFSRRLEVIVWAPRRVA
jgi:uncharacterized protein YqjF (DUF2071 family)